MAKSDDFLCRKDAALYLTSIGCPISYNTLGTMAANNNAGGGPPFSRRKGKNGGVASVRYFKGDLDSWAFGRIEKVL